MRIFEIADSMALAYNISPFDILNQRFIDFINLAILKVEKESRKQEQYTPDGKIRRKAKSWY